MPEYRSGANRKLRFLAALSFLTVIPVPLRREIDPGEVGRSLHYFPVVGAIIGLLLVGLNWLFRLFLPPALVDGLLIVSMVVISGALHLDGFIDTCDGLAGHRTVEERWRVMHDSRAGAFGIVAVFLLLLLKYVSLSSVPDTLLPLTLLLLPVVSRWAMVYAVFAYSYARPEGLGRAFKQGATRQGFIMATLITLAVITGLTLLANLAYFYLAGLAVILIVWMVVVAMAAYLKRQFAGLTGDTYGAISEVVEVVMLILVSLLAYNRWFI
ncbi:MAG: adenosylcobinamide-GDP ribazoletransferase [Dehalococcoidales bacterium]|nr:adenosylcobinamide-GDP ribazoletransferase [Dehalococcoidales bacterium]